MTKEYALYKGDELLHIGTIEEIAKAENVKPETIAYYKRPAYIKRRGNGTNYKVLVSLDD